MESLFLENKLGGQETDELATNIGQCVTNFQSSGSLAKNAARDWMRRYLKKWLAFSLCGWHNHLGRQGANTKTVTRGIHFTTWDYFQIVEKTLWTPYVKQRAPHRVPKIMWPKPVNASKVLSFHWGCGQMQPDELGLQWIFRIDFDQPTWPSQRLWIYIMEVIPQECSPRGDIQWEIFEVFARSFQQLFVGKMPCQRHDGKPSLLLSVLFLKLIFLFWQAGVFSSVVAKVIVLVPRLGKFMFFSCVKPRKSGESNAAPTVLDAMEY